MIRQIEEGDIMGGVPKDKLEEFVEFQKMWMNERI
jgi:hypothetical protein